MTTKVTNSYCAILTKIYLCRLSPSETTNEKKVQKPSTVAECFNGGMLENYMWSQTGSDVDVRIPVAGDIKGKNICVEIKDKYLKVALKNVPGTLIVRKLTFILHVLQVVIVLSFFEFE